MRKTSSTQQLLMKILLILVFLLRAECDSDVPAGYQVSLAIPPAYISGFLGRAFLMETDPAPDQPTFKTAISVVALDDRYSCSLDIFLGNLRVWSSGHFSRFYSADKCMLHLTTYGDLQLKGQKDWIGWRSGTSGQGVQRLHLLRSGNLVLVDALNLIKWQSFNFPTDIMLCGQRLSSKTRLTSFPGNNNSSTLFYSFEIQYDKIALFLNSGRWKYSYWEFRPSGGEKNITYVELTPGALEIFNGQFQKVAQITSQQQPPQPPLTFLALRNHTGNLGLYYYSAQRGGFESAYQALNATCDLPLACNPYGICTFSQSCSCILRLTTRGADCSSSSDDGALSQGLCGSSQAEMVELRGVSSVLEGVPVSTARNKVSKQGCGNMCLDNCTCAAALYVSPGDGEGEVGCFLYGMVRGVKQLDIGGEGLSYEYMVKVRRDDPFRGRSSGLKRWIAVLIGVVDGFVILIIVGGIAYYFLVIQKRRNNNSSMHTAAAAAAGHNPI